MRNRSDCDNDEAREVLNNILRNVKELRTTTDKEFADAMP